MLGIATPAAGEQLSPEQREKIVRMQSDLIWLVREGYVTEFIDGAFTLLPSWPRRVRRRSRQRRSTRRISRRRRTPARPPLPRRLLPGPAPQSRALTRPKPPRPVPPRQEPRSLALLTPAPPRRERARPIPPGRPPLCPMWGPRPTYLRHPTRRSRD